MTVKEKLLAEFVEKLTGKDIGLADAFLAGAKAGFEMAIVKADKLTFLFPIDRNKARMGQAQKENIGEALRKMASEIERG